MEKHSAVEFRAILGVSLLNLVLSGIGARNYIVEFRNAASQSIPFPEWAPFYWAAMGVGFEGILAFAVLLCGLRGRIAGAYSAAVALLLFMIGHVVVAAPKIVAGPLWISCFALGWFLFIATLLVRILPKSSIFISATQRQTNQT